MPQAALHSAQTCTICGQSETDPSHWPDLRDPVTGRQEIGFVTCKTCGQLGVCGDCEHERDCCVAMIECAGLSSECRGEVFDQRVHEATATIATRAKEARP